MEAATKKKVLQMLPSPIAVVGCKTPEQVHAFAVSWMGQCSFEPPVVWIAVRKDSFPHEYFAAKKKFTISLLSLEQEKLVKTFFKTPAPKNNKFGKIPFHLTESGLPILDECAGWIECKVLKKADPGDHTLFFGEVIDCGLNQAGPILGTFNTNMKYGG